jgi:hypothetical protein
MEKILIWVVGRGLLHKLIEIAAGKGLEKQPAGVVAVVIGLVAVFEVGLLFFPWDGPTGGRLPLVQKNQQLFENLTSLPSSAGSVDTATSLDPEKEALKARIKQLEARLYDWEKQRPTSPPPAPEPTLSLDEINHEITRIWAERHELPPPGEEATPEPTPTPAVAESFPNPSGSEPVVYTDHQIFDSRAQGPNRPECATVRAKKLMTVPTWMRSGLLVVYGCATAVEAQLYELERQQQIQAQQLRQQQLWQRMEQRGQSLDELYEDRGSRCC